MVQIICTLLKQNPSTLGELEKFCIERSVQCSLEIVNNDLKALEGAHGALKARPSFDALWHIFFKDKTYYNSQRGTNIGMPTMWTMIHVFQQMKDFPTWQSM